MGSRFRAYIDGCRIYGGIERRNGNVINGIENNFELRIYPNPVSQFADITYQLQSDSKVSITLFDATGKVLSYITKNQSRQAGQHQIELDAFHLSTGIYYLKLQLDGNITTQKLIITK